MEAVFKILPESLTEEFITKIKQMFNKNSYIELKIVEVDDETEYLLSSPQNKAEIMKSIKQLENKILVKKTIDELQA